MIHYSASRTYDLVLAGTLLLCSVGFPGLAYGQTGDEGPLADPAGLLGGAAVVDVSTPGGQGQRYLEIATPPSGELAVIRVIPLNIPGLTGGADVLYVGVPTLGSDGEVGNPGRTFIAAQLECDPVPFDFGALERIAVYAPEVTPSSKFELAEYAIQVAEAGCLDLPDSEACWSEPPLIISQGLPCDVTAPFFGPSVQIQPDYRDIQTYVKKFLGDPSAPSKAAIQVTPSLVRPLVSVNFNDLGSSIQAFLGETYLTGYSSPVLCTCPSTVECRTTSCVNNGDCRGNELCDKRGPSVCDDLTTVCTLNADCNGIGSGQCNSGFCVDACGRCRP